MASKCSKAEVTQPHFSLCGAALCSISTPSSIAACTQEGCDKWDKNATLVIVTNRELECGDCSQTWARPSALNLGCCGVLDTRIN
jgi:hypothetical protein